MPSVSNWQLDENLKACLIQAVKKKAMIECFEIMVHPVFRIALFKLKSMFFRREGYFRNTELTGFLKIK